MYTDRNYTNSNILNINTKLINQYLEKGYIVLVAGFQGIDDENNITTLGRGGSDTTATELSVYLNAERCEIYKDTECIFTADPKLVPTAQRLSHINYNDMLELSKMGAKVLSYKSVKYAKENNLNLLIKSIENNNIGTLIDNENHNTKLFFVSCTKKNFDKEKDIITFITKYDLEEKIKSIFRVNNILEYVISKSNNKISVILNNNISESALKLIHDKLILKNTVLK